MMEQGNHFQAAAVCSTTLTCFVLKKIDHVRNSNNNNEAK